MGAVTWWVIISESSNILKKTAISWIVVGEGTTVRGASCTGMMRVDSHDTIINQRGRGFAEDCDARDCVYHSHISMIRCSKSIADLSDQSGTKVSIGGSSEVVDGGISDHFVVTSRRVVVRQRMVDSGRKETINHGSRGLLGCCFT